MAGCGLLLLTAEAADAQPKPAPKPAPRRVAPQPNPQRQAAGAGASAITPGLSPQPQKNAAAKQANEGGGRADEAETRRRWNATTEHPQDAALASLLRKAYVAMSKGDHDYHGHRILAMRQTAAAAESWVRFWMGTGMIAKLRGVPTANSGKRTIFSNARNPWPLPITDPGSPSILRPPSGNFRSRWVCVSQFACWFITPIIPMNTPFKPLLPRPFALLAPFRGSQFPILSLAFNALALSPRLGVFAFSFPTKHAKQF